MSKESCFRGPFNKKKHGKGAQTLLKSERQHLYHIYRCLRTQLNPKKSLLVIRKVLSLFLNILTANDKYSLLNRGNLMQPTQILLSEKEIAFSIFFSHF